MTDFHTHTTFCDGANTPEEMILAAIDRGFTAIGLSGHGYTAFDPGYCMSKKGTREYCAQIRELKEKYREKIAVYCGVEQDIFGVDPEGDFDYKIGSVHYLYVDGVYHPIDSSPEGFAQLLQDIYGGDYDALAEDYFALVGQVLEKTGADFIGHFDLITKFSERMELPVTKRYKAAACAAIEKLIPYGKPFEINVGAMTRGYRSAPYPSAEILREIQKRGGQILLSGDCHSADRLGDYLPEAAALARECGFLCAMEWTKSGFVPCKL